MSSGLALAVTAAALVTGCGANGKPTPVAQSKPKAVHHSLSFTAVIAEIRSGVVKVVVTTCSGGDIGTGFLVGPRLVATVDHVVDSANSITLTRNGKTVAHGTVIGADAGRDIALIRTDKPVAGYRFQLTATAPKLGESVSALGFPLDLPLTLTRGLVSGSDRTIPIEGVERRQLIQTDASVNPGNSGGPLFTESGQVVGLIDAKINGTNGLGFAVSASVAAPLIQAWSTAPQPIPAATCASAPPQTQTTPASTPAPTYRAPDFTVSYPTGWSISHIAEPGHNIDATFTDPNEPALLMRVDENTSAGNLSAAQSAAPVLASLRREAGYIELSTRSETFQGLDAFRWEFEDTEQGVLLHKLDLFVVDPNAGRGWAILIQAPTSEWASDASAFNSYVQSFRDTG